MTWSMPKVLAGALVAAVAGISAGSPTSVAAQTATPRCTTGNLAVWLGLGTGGAAAGSTSYPLELTNVSGRTCRLFGFPGVSAVARGGQAGSPAGRDGSVPTRTVTLKPGAGAHAVIRIADVSAFPPATCRPVGADGLKVYPPGAFRAAVLPFRFRACSRRGPVFLDVTAVQPRVGVPGHP